MSSSPTAPTSTTGSSTSWPSPADDLRASDLRADGQPADDQPGRQPARLALIACGAIARPCAELVGRVGWRVDVHPLPPLLHNQPQRIAARVAELGEEVAPRYAAIAVGYADCGTYGALDALCATRGWHRLEGLHCYDVYAGQGVVERLFEDQPGTYLLTDFLVRSFDRTVLAELGLDRHPELQEAYFGHYTRVVWLRQDRAAGLEEQARAAAARLGLPLEVLDTGQQGLAVALQRLLTETGLL
jgi:hypothetical protein